MLAGLSIRDFTIIERLDIEFGPAMTVLTGETGAGKSILVDALSLALGERSSGSLVRPRRERAEVVASFDLRKLPAIRLWLAEHELEDANDECILRRTITNDGRSRAYVNARPVPAQTLRDLGEQLVDIHAQQAHHSLNRPDQQRAILDGHAAHAKRITELRTAYLAWEETRRALHELEHGTDAGTDLDYLRYQIDELLDLDLAAGEIERLEEEQRRLSRADELRQSCTNALQRLDGDISGTAAEQLRKSVADVTPPDLADTQLDQIRDLLESAIVHIGEASGELRNYAEQLDSDPARLDEIDRRLGRAYDLARKHGCAPPELPARLSDLQAAAHRYESGESQRTELRTRLTELESSYRVLAEKLSRSRAKAAKRFAQQITRNIQTLGMPGGTFAIDVEYDANGPPSLAGLDRVTFVVGTNPGQPQKPLARVASGGELSRISLAIQVNAASDTGIPTLIFDEVDAGIGGRIAELVGQQLRELAANRQVLCITHLPQVASQGQNHIKVQKHSRRNVTETELQSLNEAQRVEEIARMLGGTAITDRVRAHARELLDMEDPVNLEKSAG